MLLTLGETFLHGFGHDLSMFANTLRSLSGTQRLVGLSNCHHSLWRIIMQQKDFSPVHLLPLSDQVNHCQMNSSSASLKSRFLAAYGCLRQVSFGLLTSRTPKENLRRHHAL